ncbi:MAG: hypothetical protein LQ346_005606 [Caloplaca aetnensis]|nr:MAG: hypothetical protein LQ346_005606 [Caloplaca aetnensis]
MAPLASSPALQWINSVDGQKPASPSVRRMIRSQAMSRASAERRGKAKNGDRNLRQFPIRYRSLAPGDLGTGAGHDQSPTGGYQDEGLDPNKALVRWSAQPKPVQADAHGTVLSALPVWIPASPVSAGYGAMRIRYDFDVLDLSGLAPLHISPATTQPIRERPSRFLDLIRSRQWSYFSYLPWLYGNTTSLDDAICCVAARVRQWITDPGRPTDRVLALYAQAVRSLQRALDDPAQRFHPDVLCATQILSIFQMLDFESHSDVMVTHAAGAAALIQLRGPGRYQSNFEKALFLCQVGPIITEALLSVSPCFLEGPAWQSLFEEMALGKSPLSYFCDDFVKAWACISCVPGLFCRVQSAIGDISADSRATQGRLLRHVLELRARLMTLAGEQDMLLSDPSGSAQEPFLLLNEAQSGIQYDLLGLYATNLIRLERLVVALQPSGSISSEENAQRLAVQILCMDHPARAIGPRTSSSLRFKMYIAKATMATREEWRREILCRPLGEVVDKEVFDHWVAAYTKEHTR